MSLNASPTDILAVMRLEGMIDQLEAAEGYLPEQVRNNAIARRKHLSDIEFVNQNARGK